MQKKPTLSRMSRAEVAAEAATRTSRALVEDENSTRNEKTERLREARLARDAQAMKTGDITRSCSPDQTSAEAEPTWAGDGAQRGGRDVADIGADLNEGPLE